MKIKSLVIYSGITLMGLSMITGCGKKQSSTSDTVAVNTENIAGETDSSSEQANVSTTETASVNSNTVAGKLKEQFITEISSDKDINNVAIKLTENKVFTEIAMGTMPVSEGLLDGFDGEIKGFKQGIKFSPMIGSMPFVGYIFETDSPDELVSLLEEKSQLNWNICTVADEKISAVSDNYVLFIMAPYSFD